jgi:hypothetical protein
MRRRNFIALLGGAAVGFPPTTWARQRAKYRLSGFFGHPSPTRSLSHLSNDLVSWAGSTVTLSRSSIAIRKAVLSASLRLRLSSCARK